MSIIIRSTLKTFLFIIILIQSNLTIGQGSYLVSEEVIMNPDLIGEFGNRLLMISSYTNIDGFPSTKLTVSDGTPEGTFRMGDPDQLEIFFIGKTNEVAYFVERFGSQYYFSELRPDSNELTRLIRAANNPLPCILWNEDIYYSTFSGLKKFTPSTSTDQLLWSTDFYIDAIEATQEEVLFIAGMEEGKMLGKTDGTLENTSVFHEIHPDGNEWLHSYFMVSTIDKMFFGYGPIGDQFNFWVSDGTSEGTFVLKTAEYPGLSYDSRHYAILDGKFYCLIRDVGESFFSSELYVSDGTMDGTYNLNPEVTSFRNPQHLTIFNNKIYFVSGYDNGALMSTDGTIEGTQFLIQPTNYPSSEIEDVNEITLYNGKLAMAAQSETYGYELFISDGTLDGTALLSDIVPGIESYVPQRLTTVGDLIFFNANNYLWVYDPNLGTNVLDHSYVNSFNLFPNPMVTGDLNLNISFAQNVNEINIEIVDIIGQRIHQEKNVKVSGNNFEYKIPINEYQPGEYIISISSDNQKIVADKFIVGN